MHPMLSAVLGPRSLEKGGTTQNYKRREREYLARQKFFYVTVDVLILSKSGGNKPSKSKN
eukprot:2691090-Amphidinium_carterae.1